MFGIGEKTTDWVEGIEENKTLKRMREKIEKKIEQKQPLNLVDTLILAYGDRPEKPKSGQINIPTDFFSKAIKYPNFIKQGENMEGVANVLNGDDASESWKLGIELIKKPSLGLSEGSSFIASAKSYLQYRHSENMKSMVSSEGNPLDERESLSETIKLIDNIISENNQ